MSEEEANQQNFLSQFPYYANEAMTQICSAVKSNDKYYRIDVFPNTDKYKDEKYHCDDIITMPDDFLVFSDDALIFKQKLYIDDRVISDASFEEVENDYIEYYGYNEVICHNTGVYHIPYKARWFFFTKDLSNNTVITAPADVCEAIPSYIVSQCLKIDDELKAATYRNEFEIFLARIDNTSLRSSKNIKIGGGW